MASFRKISSSPQAKGSLCGIRFGSLPQKKQIGFRINSPLRAEFSGMTTLYFDLNQRS
jgi:hypothetical protein